MKRHVLILLENETFPWDRRVRREGDALVEAGYDVTVVAPTRDGFEGPEETVGGVRVLRYPAPPSGEGPLGYLREYAVSMLNLWRLGARVHREKPVDVVIACNPPDMLPMLARLLPRPRPSVIFDHHDLSPELFERKFGKRGPLHRLLLRVEQGAFGVADVVMASNESYAEVARTRGGVDRDRVFVVRNAPDPRRIFPVEARPELRGGHRNLVVWAGSMTQRNRCARLLDAAEEVVRKRGRDDVGFVLVGRGEARDALVEEVHARGLTDAVALPGPAGDELLRAYLATADVCVSVDEQNDMNHMSTVTKVLDYMAMGRPVVQFPLREMQRVCGTTTVYARNGDAQDLSDQILALLDDPERRARMGEQARRRALAGLMWPDQVPALLAAVERALELRRGRATRRGARARLPRGRPAAGPRRRWRARQPPP